MIKYYGKQTLGGVDEALGYINISPDTIIQQESPKSFCVITPKRTYFLYSDTPEDCEEWLKILNSSLRRVSGKE